MDASPTGRLAVGSENTESFIVMNHLRLYICVTMPYSWICTLHFKMTWRRPPRNGYQMHALNIGQTNQWVTHAFATWVGTTHSYMFECTVHIHLCMCLHHHTQRQICVFLFMCF